jgi:hypothetical protein
MITSRRSFLSLLAAPAIVRVASIMPVRALRKDFLEFWNDEYLDMVAEDAFCRVPPLLTTYIDPRIYEILSMPSDASLDLGWPQRRQLWFDV